MNRAYKVIYNKKRRLVQVVSEISGGFTRAERQGRRSLLRGLVLSCLVGASLIAAPLPSYAATTEEQVAANSAAIAQNKTNIAANKTAIESNQSGIRAVTRTVEAQQASISGKAEQTDLNKETAERKAADTRQMRRSLPIKRPLIKTKPISQKIKPILLPHKHPFRERPINLTLIRLAPEYQKMPLRLEQTAQKSMKIEARSKNLLIPWDLRQTKVGPSRGSQG